MNYLIAICILFSSMRIANSQELKIEAKYYDSEGGEAKMVERKYLYPDNKVVYISISDKGFGIFEKQWIGNEQSMIFKEVATYVPNILAVEMFLINPLKWDTLDYSDLVNTMDKYYTNILNAAPVDFDTTGIREAARQYVKKEIVESYYENNKLTKIKKFDAPGNLYSLTRCKSVDGALNCEEKFKDKGTEFLKRIVMINLDTTELTSIRFYKHYKLDNLTMDTVWTKIMGNEVSRKLSFDNSISGTEYHKEAEIKQLEVYSLLNFFGLRIPLYEFELGNFPVKNLFPGVSSYVVDHNGEVVEPFNDYHEYIFDKNGRIIEEKYFIAEPGNFSKTTFTYY